MAVRTAYVASIETHFRRSQVLRRDRIQLTHKPEKKKEVGTEPVSLSLIFKLAAFLTVHSVFSKK